LAQSTGIAPYIVLGVLTFAVLGAFLVVNASNQVKDKKAHLAQLEEEAEQAQSTAQQTGTTGSVKSIAQGQFDAVAATIDSRFNFERRLRQLSHILPGDVTITELTASITGGDTGEGDAAADTGAGGTGSGGAESSQPAGPGFKIKGCSLKRDWTAVAVLITRMRNLDGVISVKVTDDLSAGGSDGGGSSGATDGGGTCGKNDWTFGLSVIFKPKDGAGAGAPGAGGTVAGATATELAQGAAATSDQANSAAGADQPGGGASP
jgi:hypothetical protein